MNSGIVDNSIALKITSPFEAKEGLKTRAKQRRLEANLTQEGLARRANVSFGTLKHFEKTGDASIEFLLAIAFALGAEQEFDGLFPPRPYKTIEDVIEKRPRLRGRRK
jgi:transcriptional regulator with XRE-family HTH domain